MVKYAEILLFVFFKEFKLSNFSITSNSVKLIDLEFFSIFLIVLLIS